jgi:3-hydroxyacyl-CoA dehydrogenase
MYYADTLGAQKVLDVMSQLAEADKSMRVSPLLIELVSTGGKFVDIDTGGLKV